MAPAAPMSSAVSGLPSTLYPKVMRPSRSRRSLRLVARPRMAMTSLATVMS